jgi:integrase
MPGPRLPVRKIRDVLRLSAAGMSRRQIAVSLGVSATAARDCILRARRAGLAWPLPEGLTDETLEAATPTEHLTFLVTEFGKPFTAAGFGNWFRERCNEAGLPHCSAHGLRKAACRRLAEAGCSAKQIAAISGHQTLREVERYTRAADQKKLASQALAQMIKNTGSDGG